MHGGPRRSNLTDRTGRYLKTVALGGQPSAFVHFAADSAAALDVPEATLTQLRRLVGESSDNRTAERALIDDDMRHSWADIAAMMESHKGREWRPLADTAVGAQLGYAQPPDWRARVRGTDFYRESAARTQ